MAAPPLRSTAPEDLSPARAPGSLVSPGLVPDDATADLSRDDEPDADHGRIGYGRYGRFTPVALAVLLILGLGAIGLAQRGDNPAAASPIVGEPAPDVTLTLLDGTPLRLADLRGSVVVLNFWASWCRYCPDEMRELQSFSDTATRDGERVAVVGVGARTDIDADARAFVSRLNLTYPIGRDNATDRPGVGPIERAFGTATEYPATIFIRPDGIVDRFHLGPLTSDQLRQGVDAARDGAAS